MTAPSRAAVPRPLGRAAAGALLVLLAATFVGSTAPAHAEESTVGIAGAPASDTGPDGRSRFTYEAAPGQTVSDRFVVRNTGTTEQQVTVFGSDAYNTNDGAFALLETHEKPTDAGGWVAFGEQAVVQLTLAPAAEQILDFTVTVPADATPGDHAAGIVVSAQAAEGQVTVDRRVATRLYVRVAGALTPGLTISSISAAQGLDWNPFAGPTDVTVTVQNTGNVALGADVTARITSWFGMSAGASVHEELSELLPGATREVTFHVHGVPRLGLLQPEVLLAPTVSDAAPDPGPLAAVTRETSLVSIPWLAISAVGVVAAFVLLARWRRARLARQAAEWAEYTRAEARREAEARSAQVEAGAAR